MLLIKSRAKKPGEIDFYQVVNSETVFKLPVSYCILQYQLMSDSPGGEQLGTRKTGFVPDEKVNFSFNCSLNSTEAERPPLQDLQTFLKRFFSINIIRLPKIRDKIIMNISIGKVTGTESKNEAVMAKCFATWHFIDAARGIETGPALQGHFVLSRSPWSNHEEKRPLQDSTVTRDELR